MSLSKLSFLLISMFSELVIAASFDCTRAGSCVEKTICGHFQLSQADEQMGVAYENLKKTLTSAQALELQIEQRDWLEQRDSNCPCKDINCLLSMYFERTEIINFRTSREYVASSTVKVSGKYVIAADYQQMVMVVRPLSEKQVAIQINGAQLPQIRWLCSFAGIGALQDHTVTIPHESEGTPITFSFSPQSVEVQGEALDHFCGLGGTIKGNYTKVKEKV